MRKPLALVALAFSIGVPAVATTIVSKPPDVGAFWNPLSPSGGSYVYANSFVAPPGETKPARLGTWLVLDEGPAPGVRFEIWADSGGGVPDASAVMATTGSVLPAADGTLTYFEYPISGAFTSLTPGETYWFVATVVGESGAGAYQAGGHTQNSVYADDGMFAVSNEPSGVVFVDLGPPEMAFEVELERGILVYDNPCLGSPSYFLAAIQNLGVPYTSFVNDSSAFAAALAGGNSWDLVVVDSYGNALASEAVTALIDHVNGGGHLAIAHWNLFGLTELVTALDATVGAPFLVVLPTYAWRPAEPIFLTPNELPNPMTPSGDACVVDGARFDANPYGRALGGYTASPGSGEAALVLGNSGRTVLVGELPGNFGGDANGNKNADGYDLAVNVVDYLLRSIVTVDHDSGNFCGWTSATGWTAHCECGDGNIDPGEECDDGNLATGDACDAYCRVGCTGNCGGSVGGGLCYCDSLCQDKGDCCYDACTVCGPCGPVGPGVSSSPESIR